MGQPEPRPGSRTWQLGHSTLPSRVSGRHFGLEWAAMPADQTKAPKRHADCVVLCPPGAEPDAELIAALDRRELTIRRPRPADTKSGSRGCGEFAAMAKVCQLMKATVADVRAGRESRGVILLIVEPRLLDKAPDLVHAIERYAPHAAIWCYQAASSPRMRPVTPDDVSSWLDPDSHEHPRGASDPLHSASPTSVPPRSAIAPAHTQPPAALGVNRRANIAQPVLPDHRVFLDLDSSRQAGQSRKNREPLSQAELAMLLADEPFIDHNGSNGHGELDAGRPGGSHEADKGFGGG